MLAGPGLKTKGGRVRKTGRKFQKQGGGFKKQVDRKQVLGGKKRRERSKRMGSDYGDGDDDDDDDDDDSVMMIMTIVWWMWALVDTMQISPTSNRSPLGKELLPTVKMVPASAELRQNVEKPSSVNPHHYAQNLFFVSPPPAT